MKNKIPEVTWLMSFLPKKNVTGRTFFVTGQTNIQYQKNAPKTKPMSKILHRIMRIIEIIIFLYKNANFELLAKKCPSRNILDICPVTLIFYLGPKQI